MEKKNIKYATICSWILLHFWFSERHVQSLYTIKRTSVPRHSQINFILLQAIIIWRRHVTSVTDNGFISLHSSDETSRPTSRLLQEEFELRLLDGFSVLFREEEICMPQRVPEIAETPTSNIFICPSLSACQRHKFGKIQTQPFEFLR